MSTFARQLATLQAALVRLDRPEVQERIERAITLAHDALSTRKPLLVCGNGGSAADAQHIAGELVGRFLRERHALNVIALGADVAVLTAWANDYDYETVFARQVEAHALPGAVLLAISTSGNSKNVLAAARTARERGMKVIALTGEGGGKLAEFADVLLDVPSRETPRIQEMHVMLYHYFCEQLEARA